ncbi:helix-turn-helix domain-containing protein [Oricola indica]|uniref:AraC family transcriptional regulator n=1 Tax=Oricola indica TaxID=2872591 RepID=UPI003CCC266B
MASELPHFTKLPIYVSRRESGLQRRIETLKRGVGEKAHILFLLADGDARIEGRGSETALSGPSIAWRQAAGDFRLVMEAGSAGFIAEIAEETLVRSIGDFFESAALHTLFDSDWVRSFEDDRGAHDAVRRHLDSILDEVTTPQAATGMMIVAHLRIILVTILRASGIDEVASFTHGNNAHYLQRFRQLLEAGFRAHHPVGHYAQELGITHDRLHAICVRELDKTPKSLIAERLAREAALGLERSTLSIKQLSYSLGFRDPAHFSNFFRRMTGLPPGRFRKMMAVVTPDSGDFSPPSFADWP